MKRAITKFRYKKEFWLEDDLVWLPKVKREKVRRNAYAVKKSLILEIADTIKQKSYPH